MYFVFRTVAFAVLLLMISTIPAPAQESSEALYVLSGGRLIDGTGGQPVEDSVVVVQGRRILAAGARDAVQIPPGAAVVDVAGMTLLPGFFNCHVHGQHERPVRRLWAQQGVTTLRDVGTTEYVFRAYSSLGNSEPRSARVLYCGTIINQLNGVHQAHHYFAEVDSVEQARGEALQRLGMGADHIKIYLDTGYIRGEQGAYPVMSVEMIRAIVSEAHSRGVKVSAHANEVAMCQLAVDGGVDDVAHCLVDAILPDELIAQMVEQNVYLVPTLEVIRELASADDLARAKENLRRLVEGGVNIALGNDIYSSSGIQPGMPSVEIALMAQAQMTPMQIIVAATRNSAFVCNLSNELGTLEAGKTADILVVQGDPLEDLGVLSLGMRMVVRSGVIIRDDLNLGGGLNTDPQTVPERSSGRARGMLVNLFWSWPVASPSEHSATEAPSFRAVMGFVKNLFLQFGRGARVEER